jgi:hypothetical protein
MHPMSVNPLTNSPDLEASSRHLLTHRQECASSGSVRVGRTERSEVQFTGRLLPNVLIQESSRLGADTHMLCWKTGFKLSRFEHRTSHRP